MTNTMMTNKMIMNIIMVKLKTTKYNDDEFEDGHHLCSRFSLPVRRCERETIIGARVQGKNLPGTTHYHIRLISFLIIGVFKNQITLNLSTFERFCPFYLPLEKFLSESTRLETLDESDHIK